jgi:hypothetical protein
MGFPLSVLFSVSPIGMINHLFWIKPRKKGFFVIEVKVPFKFVNLISAIQVVVRIFIVFIEQFNVK